MVEGFSTLCPVYDALFFDTFLLLQSLAEQIVDRDLPLLQTQSRAEVRYYSGPNTPYPCSNQSRCTF